MIKIQDAEWTTVGQMWWAFVWRVVVIGTLIGLVVGFIFGFLGAIMGNTAMGQMMGMGFSMLLNLPVSIWAYRAALTKRFDGVSAGAGGRLNCCTQHALALALPSVRQ